MSQEENKQGVTISRRTLGILLLIAVLLIAGGVALGMNWSRWFGRQEPAASEAYPFQREKENERRLN